jgi:hypothetical protein
MVRHPASRIIVLEVPNTKDKEEYRLWILWIKGSATLYAPCAKGVYDHGASGNRKNSAWSATPGSGGRVYVMSGRGSMGKLLFEVVSPDDLDLDDEDDEEDEEEEEPAL